MAVDDIYTKSLLHMDGADAGTVFVDESAKAWTARNHAQIDTAQYQFGGACGLFDGTDDYVDTPDHEDFTVGAGDFTVDFWIRPSVINQADKAVFGHSDGVPANSSMYIELNSDESLTGYIFYGASNVNISTVASVYAANTWLHVAFVRYGNDLYIFSGGTKSASVGNVTGVTVNNSTATPALGRLGSFNGMYYAGWIDEFRFSKGIARWTANFTPPTAPYGPLIIANSQVIII